MGVASAWPAARGPCSFRGPSGSRGARRVPCSWPPPWTWAGRWCWRGVTLRASKTLLFLPGQRPQRSQRQVAAKPWARASSISHGEAALGIGDTVIIRSAAASHMPCLPASAGLQNVTAAGSQQLVQLGELPLPGSRSTSSKHMLFAPRAHACQDHAPCSQVCAVCVCVQAKSQRPAPRRRAYSGFCCCWDNPPAAAQHAGPQAECSEVACGSAAPPSPDSQPEPPGSGV
jgi:hypothetical protein